MIDLAGDPNWLLSSVVQATAVLLGLLAIFVLVRHGSASGQRRTVELRRLEVQTLIRLRSLQLNPPGNSGETLGAEAEPSRDLALAELAVLQSEADRLEAAFGKLDRTARPWFGLFVLGYMAVTGILLPLALMPARSAAFDPSAVWSLWGLELSGLAWKRLIVAGFASGLMLALLQVVWVTARGSVRTASES